MPKSTFIAHNGEFTAVKRVLLFATLVLGSHLNMPRSNADDQWQQKDPLAVLPASP